MLYCRRLAVVDALVAKHVHELLDKLVVRASKAAVVRQWLLGLLDINDTIAHGANERRDELEENDVALGGGETQLVLVLFLVPVGRVTLDSGLEGTTELVLTVRLHLERACLGGGVAHLRALG